MKRNAVSSSSPAVLASSILSVAPRRVIRRRTALRSSSALVAVIALPVAVMSLGVVLPRPAQAQTVLGSSSTTPSLSNYNTGNPFTINAGTTIATGSGDGVFGNNSNNWTVTNYGTVSGGTANGIGFDNGGTITNAGTYSYETGLRLGTITGATDGVYINGSPGSVSNLGKITGTGNVGIDLLAGGTVTTSGQVYGASVGVDIAGGAGSLVNGGSIFVSGATGVGAQLSAGGSVNNDRYISAATGISLSSGGYAYNEGYGLGYIRAKYDGIRITGQAGTVSNHGTIWANNYNSVQGHGIYLGDGGAVTNTASASVAGYGAGVEITGAAGTLQNYGAITGMGNSANGVGVGASLGSGGYVGNHAGTIFGSFIGVGVTGFGTLVNSGSIYSSNTGVLMHNGGSVSNSGSIGGLSNGVAVYGAALTLGNTGTITGNIGVFAQAGGTVTNTDGTILGAANGVEFYGAPGTVINSGTISIGGGVTPTVVLGLRPNNVPMENGVYMSNGGNVTNQSGGYIYGTSNGVKIYGTNAGYVTNASGGFIKGGTTGVVLGATGSVVNAGSIYGGLYAGVDLKYGGTVTNQASGQIYGYRYGVSSEGAPISLSNAGTITGMYQGASLYGGTATNVAGGLITGGHDGVSVYTGSGTVLNSGTISDTGATFNGTFNTRGAGVYLYDGGAVTNSSGGVITAVDGTYQSTLAPFGAVGVLAEYGVATVQNDGSISGNFGGVGLLDGGTITNSGSIYGGFVGAYAVGVSNTLVNNFGGTIRGNAYGVALGNFGSTLASTAYLDNQGSIYSQNVGVEIGGTGSIVNGASAVIFSAGSLAIHAFGPTSIDNAGAVDAFNGIGIEFGAGGTLTNASGGTITAYGDAVTGDGGSAAITVDNAGVINSGDFTGVFLGSGGSVINELGGTIQGAIYGVNFAPAGTLASNTLVNAGYIYGDEVSARLSGGNVSNAASGTIHGGNDGILNAGAAGTIVNAGLVQGRNDFGILLNQGGNVTNVSGGTITGPLAGIINSAHLYSATIDNAGVILAANGAGIVALGGGGITNRVGGTISGATSGVYSNYNAQYVSNAGLISATGTAGDGVLFAGGGGGVTNSASATITGNISGVAIFGDNGSVGNAGLINGGVRGISMYGGNITNAASGLITGGFESAYLQNNGTVINSGTIVDYGTTTLAVTNASSINTPAAVYLLGGGSVVNNTGGTISVSSSDSFGLAGVLVNGGDVTNAGVIGGQVGVEVLGLGSTVTNESGGSIGGLVGVLANGMGDSVSNAAGGTIAGGVFGVGLFNEDANRQSGTVTGNNTFENAGTVTADVFGVLLVGGGTVGNAAGGIISSGSVGIGSYGYSSLIDNAGTVQSTEGTGIKIANSDGTLTNASTGLIEAYGNGVGAYAGSYAVNIENAGTITAQTRDGVYLSGAGSVTNAATGTISGHAVGVQTSTYAVGSVVNSGLITVANQGGGTGVGLALGGSVTNNVGGTITAPGYGIVITGGAGYVDNAGSIIGAAAIGVRIENGGSVNNQAGALIYGGQAGVLVQGGGNVTNAGSIESNVNHGFALEVLPLTGNSTVTNSGLITGGGGVQIGGDTASTGTLVNTAGATISGYYDGVFMNPGNASANNAGIVIAQTGYGIDLDGDFGGTLTNGATGTVTAGRTGVFVYGPGVVQNAGSIAGKTYDGVYLYNGGTVTNTGLITGGNDGVALGGEYYIGNRESTLVTSSTLVNSGSIEGGVIGVTGYGSSFSVQNSGLISGATGVSLANGPLTLDNTGTIIGSYGDAVDLPVGGTVSNGGVIMGTVNGIVAAAPANVTNPGVIEGTGAAGYGLVLGAGGTVSSAAGGLIAGGAGGISVAQYAGYVQNAGSITGGTGDAVDLAMGGTVGNAAGGVIAAQGAGVALGATGSVGNAGVISGGTDGVDLAGGGSLTNSGTIIGGTDGVAAPVGAGVFNSGTIVGTTHDGVMLLGGALGNAAGGYIKGGTDGVYAVNANISNSGTIVDDSTAGAMLGDNVTMFNNGDGEVAGATGIAFTGTGSSVFNNGTIASTNGGNAVSFDAAGTNTLTLATGTVIRGTIDGGGSNSQIDLVGTGTLSNTIANFGAGSSVTVQPGAVWTAYGNWTAATVVNLGTFQAGVLNPDPPLVLQGNFVQAPGASLQVVVTPTLSTQFLVTGTAKIAGNLQYIFTPGTYMPKTYKFLTATGGVTGNFATINYSGDVPPTVAVEHGTTMAPVTYNLVLSRGTGVPGNNGATVVTPADDATFGAQSEAMASAAQLANDSLLGHADAAVSGDDAAREAACQAAQRTPNDATSKMGKMATAMASAFCGAGGWLEATGAVMDVNADGAAPSFHADTGGFLAGIDKAVDDTGGRLGLAVGYDETWLHDDARGKGTIGTTRVGLYGAQPFGRFTLAADFMYGHADNTTERQTGVGPANAKYDSNIVSGAAQISTGMLFDGFGLVPSAGLRFAHVDGRGFSETGAGYVPLFAVAGSSPEYTSVQPFVKLGISRSYVTPSYLVITPTASIGYDYEAGDRGKAASVTAADGTGFRSSVNRLDASAANVSAGISVGRGNFSLYARYNAYLSGNWTAQTGEAGVAVKF